MCPSVLDLDAEGGVVDVPLGKHAHRELSGLNQSVVLAGVRHWALVLQLVLQPLYLLLEVLAFLKDNVEPLLHQPEPALQVVHEPTVKRPCSSARSSCQTWVRTEKPLFS